jgi:hypothetical protein
LSLKEARAKADLPIRPRLSRLFGDDNWKGEGKGEGEGKSKSKRQKQKQKQKQKQILRLRRRMTTKRQRQRQRRCGWAGHVIPPIAKCAMDGAPDEWWLVEEDCGLLSFDDDGGAVGEEFGDAVHEFVGVVAEGDDGVGAELGGVQGHHGEGVLAGLFA